MHQRSQNTEPWGWNSASFSWQSLKLASKAAQLIRADFHQTHMAAFLLLIFTTTGSQCPAGRDLAACFCSTKLFLLLPQTEQPAPRWAGHQALQGWINNHNKIFVRLSEWTMYSLQLQSFALSILNLPKIVQSFRVYVKYSTCYISLVPYPYF